ncbi:helix-turn-helix domain-containing protein [Streptomyces sp. NPDC002676]
MTTGRIELGATGRAVAANLKRLRKERGMSLRALSEALAAVGRPLSQDAINKIENGAEEDTKKQIRRVDVDDLTALAVVLNVNPSSLLLQHDDARRIAPEAEVTGAGKVPGWLAWGWADGVCPLVDPESDPDGTKWLDYALNSRPAGWNSTRSVGLNRGREQQRKAFEERFQGFDEGGGDG